MTQGQGEAQRLGVRQTTEQRRASHALACVRDVKTKGYAGKYAAQVQRLPAMLLANGLGQSLAFLCAKHGGEHLAAYAHLARWVEQELGLNGDLLEAVTCMDVRTYRRAQVEALAVLTWLKRFAAAELPQEDAP